MKNEYIKPSINVMEIEMGNMLAASNFIETETTDTNIYDDPMNPNDALTRKNRGSWGDLWE